ncbi:MAG: MarR family transcriptional regulator [Pseudomonadota bacterium]
MAKNTRDKTTIDGTEFTCLDLNASSVLFGLSLVNKAKLHLKTPLRKANLTLTQWLVLKIIYLKRADTPTLISKTIDADPTTITRHLDSLSKRGLITRTHDENDRRVITLTITKKGTEVAKQLYKSYTGIFNDFDRYMTDDEATIWKKIEKAVCGHIVNTSH